MRILVSGGAGYIGSVVTEQLVAAGEDVVVFDNLSQGHRDAVHPKANLIVGDLSDVKALTDVFANQKIDAIMHFASNTLVGESMVEPFKYLGDNITNGLNLLHTAIDHGVRRFILSSTANLFDRPERMPIDEQENIVPGSPYGESKYILERVLAWLERTHGLHYAALRYFNAAGASPRCGESHDPETHLIPIVLQVAAGQREKVVVFGDDYPTVDGSCVRDYVHVVDLAQAHILALGALANGSRTYNLGNGSGFSVLQVVETVREVTGKPIPVEMGSRRPGDPATLIASSDRIRKELGWQPQYPHLRDIVETAWNWHQSHPGGYAS